MLSCPNCKATHVVKNNSTGKQHYKCRQFVEQPQKKYISQETWAQINNTLRQRVSRLVRKTLSFSKKLENHIGAIIYFISHYNKSLLILYYLISMIIEMFYFSRLHVEINMLK